MRSRNCCLVARRSAMLMHPAEGREGRIEVLQKAPDLVFKAMKPTGFEVVAGSTDYFTAVRGVLYWIRELICNVSGSIHHNNRCRWRQNAIYGHTLLLCGKRLRLKALLLTRLVFSVGAVSSILGQTVKCPSLYDIVAADTDDRSPQELRHVVLTRWCMSLSRYVG